jgi:hypothetical protein
MSPQQITVMSWGFVAFLFVLEVLALVAVYRLLKGDRLEGLILESDGSKASLSRLQALIFTFAVAGLFMVFSLDIGDFIEIPESVLGLLGISGGTYLISKGISKPDVAKNPPRKEIE